MFKIKIMMNAIYNNIFQYIAKITKKKISLIIFNKKQINLWLIL